MASDGCVRNKPCVLWADIFNGNDFFNATQANISIFTPQNSSYVSNVGMQRAGFGRFTYNYTANTTGNWYGFVQYYNSTQYLTTASLSWEVTEGFDVIALTQFLGLLVFVLFFMYLGHRFTARDPEGKKKTEISILFGWLFYMAVGLFLTVMMSFLSIIGQGESYYQLIHSILLIVMTILGSFSLIGFIIIGLLLIWFGYQRLWGDKRG